MLATRYTLKSSTKCYYKRGSSDNNIQHTFLKFLLYMFEIFEKYGNLLKIRCDLALYKYFHDVSEFFVIFFLKTRKVFQKMW